MSHRLPSVIAMERLEVRRLCLRTNPPEFSGGITPRQMSPVLVVSGRSDPRPNGFSELVDCNVLCREKTRVLGPRKCIWRRVVRIIRLVSVFRKGL